MLKTSKEIRNNNFILINNEFFFVLKSVFSQTSHGKKASSAVMKIKMKNLKTGHIKETVFDSNEKINVVVLNKNEAEVVSIFKDFCQLMNCENFEVFEVDKDFFEFGYDFLKKGLKINYFTYQDKLVYLEMPTEVEVEILETASNFSGGTVSNPSKNAILSNGFKIQVPTFCKIGDKIKINIVNKIYVERIKNG